MNGWAHWGKGVNPEYERISPDSDGDGLSDRFEELTGRDPKDGRLVFTFDCGGWQTEGWIAMGHLPNIAGFQGFLDFDLPDGKGAIARKGLKLDPARNQGPISIRLRASEDTVLTAYANLKPMATNTITANGEFQTVSFPPSPGIWAGEISSLGLTFSGPKGTTIEIDSIECAAR